MVITENEQFLARGNYNFTCLGGGATLEFKTEDMPAFSTPKENGTFADGDNGTISMPECQVRISGLVSTPTVTLNLVDRAFN